MISKAQNIRYMTPSEFLETKQFDDNETFNYQEKYHALRLECVKAIDTIDALEKIQKKHIDQLTLSIQKIRHMTPSKYLDTKQLDDDRYYKSICH